MICGPLAQHPPSPRATATNPTVLLEVTSDSSEEYDSVEKLAFYRSIPTLRDYILVSHRQRRITVHSRDEAGNWTERSAGPGGSVTVTSLGAVLAPDEIYRGSRIA